LSPENVGSLAAPGAGEIGRVVGKQGRTAAALRTLASAAGEKAGRTVTLEIRDTPFDSLKR